MASRPSRPLPTPPGPVNPLGTPDHDHIYSPAHPYRIPLSRPEYPPGPSFPVDEERPAATLRGGTLLHKGFYDLLALIPTPSPSRILWGAGADFPPDVVAGPRYEDLPSTNAPPSNSPPQLSVYYYPLAPCHQRRQDESVKYPNLQVLCEFTITAHPHLLTSTPTSHLVHASDADQAEALLTRCGPDGLGKLGGQHPSSRSPFPHHYFTVRLTLGHTHQGSSARGKPGSRDY